MEIDSTITIRSALKSDIASMVSLSKNKRLDYEKAQPQFWKYAQGAEAIQAKWFAELLIAKDYILLVAEQDKQIQGFIIGRIVPAPEVYDPGGLTLMIDDFCVSWPKLWHRMGKAMIDAIKLLAKSEGAAQILVVCGAHDIEKKRFLKEVGLTIASEWYVGGINLE